MSKRRKMISRLKDVQRAQAELAREEKELRRGITRLGVSQEEVLNRLVSTLSDYGIHANLLYRREF